MDADDDLESLQFFPLWATHALHNEDRFEDETHSKSIFISKNLKITERRDLISHIRGGYHCDPVMDNSKWPSPLSDPWASGSPVKRLNKSPSIDASIFLANKEDPSPFEY